MTIIEDQFQQLKLTGMREAYTLQLAQPNTYDDLCFSERLELLLNNEITCRHDKKIQRLIKQARFRLAASLNQIDYSQQRSLQKQTISDIAQMQWLKHHQNILIEGATGTGKTYLACAIGRHLCERGISVRYFRSTRLFELITLSHGDGTFGSLLAQLAKTQLLIIDDWGLSQLNQQQRNDLLEIMDDRHGVSSTMMTSQLPIKKWHEIFGDPTLADAILDRLIHNARKLKIKGESMRKKQPIIDEA